MGLPDQRSPTSSARQLRASGGHRVVADQRPELLADLRSTLDELIRNLADARGHLCLDRRRSRLPAVPRVAAVDLLAGTPERRPDRCPELIVDGSGELAEAVVEPLAPAGRRSAEDLQPLPGRVELRLHPGCDCRIPKRCRLPLDRHPDLADHPSRVIDRAAQGARRGQSRGHRAAAPSRSTGMPLSASRPPIGACEGVDPQLGGDRDDGEMSTARRQVSPVRRLDLPPGGVQVGLGQRNEDDRTDLPRLCQERQLGAGELSRRVRYEEQRVGEGEEGERGGALGGIEPADAGRVDERPARREERVRHTDLDGLDCQAVAGVAMLGHELRAADPAGSSRP